MNLPKLFFVSALVAGACHAASQANLDGLVEVRSRQLDQVKLRPLADFAAYRQVLIETVAVNVRTAANTNERFLRRMPPEEAKEVADAAAASVHNALVEAFKARGYEISAAAAPGVLRLSPRVVELVANAAGDGRATFTFTREAGEATLILEARDAMSGALLAHIAHHGVASQTPGLTRANAVTTRFWFEAFFSRWAASSAGALRR